MIRALLAALGVLAISSGAAAQDDSSGYYVEGRGGASFVPGSELKDTTGELAEIGLSQIEAELQTGFLVEGAVGYAYDRSIRSEVSLGYHRNRIDGLSAMSNNGPVTADVDGDVSTFTALASFYYDSPIGFDLVPFVGGGIGPAVVVFELDGEQDADLVFALQLTGGLAYELTPKTALTLRYVHLSTTDPEFEGVAAVYRSHNIMLGIRYRF